MVGMYSYRSVFEHTTCSEARKVGILEGWRRSRLTSCRSDSKSWPTSGPTSGHLWDCFSDHLLTISRNLVVSQRARIAPARIDMEHCTEKSRAVGYSKNGAGRTAHRSTST